MHCNKKIFLISSSETPISNELCSLIKKKFNCDIRTIDPKDLNPLNGGQPDLVCWIENQEGLPEIQRNFWPAVPKILVPHTQNGNGRDAAIPPQFDDVILNPFNESEVQYRIGRFIDFRKYNRTDLVKQKLFRKMAELRLIGQHPTFLNALMQLSSVADSEVTILISGETGVGKEVCARAVHYLSNRADKPFIPVNCGAIPTNLLENELFGHKKGAFTDARTNEVGIVAEAESGTLFLDEIDALTLEAQTKLLRLLQDKSYKPLGETRDRVADIRLIAATNVDLRERIEKCCFRSDLFYRLSVIHVSLPPLRDRRSDIPLLADYFIKKFSSRLGRGNKSFSKAAIQKLSSYEWAGNIRELENIIQQAILLSPTSVILPEYIKFPDQAQVHSDNEEMFEKSFREAKQDAIEKFEKEYVTRLLFLCDGNITHAAQKANKDRADFSRLVKKHGIDMHSLGMNPLPDFLFCPTKHSCFLFKFAVSHVGYGISPTYVIYLINKKLSDYSIRWCSSIPTVSLSFPLVSWVTLFIFFNNL